MILEPETAFHPSSRLLRIPVSAACFAAAPLGISLKFQMVKAAKAKLSALT
jgi:hypothetical protein